MIYNCRICGRDADYEQGHGCANGTPDNERHRLTLKERDEARAQLAAAERTIEKLGEDAAAIAGRLDRAVELLQEHIAGDTCIPCGRCLLCYTLDFLSHLTAPSQPEPAKAPTPHAGQTWDYQLFNDEPLRNVVLTERCEPNAWATVRHGMIFDSAWTDPAITMTLVTDAPLPSSWREQMTEPTQEQVDQERERASRVLRETFLWIEADLRNEWGQLAIKGLATALARRALESLVEAEAVAALHIAPVLIDNGCDCDFEGPHEGLPCEELGHEPCDMCRIERGLNAIRALRDGKR